MAASTEAVAALTQQRLMTLPIRPIFENCSEKENLTALKFMCLVDFHANYSIKLYDRIKEVQQPKLLGQLLQFRDFVRFRYVHYPVIHEYGNKVLQCKYCQLIGPWGCILSHTVISHGVHTGLKTCVFCNRETLDSHISNNSLPQCYVNYIERYDIQIDENVCEIVANFYEMMRKLSKTLNICSDRTKHYLGQGYRRKEVLSQDYGGDILPECIVSNVIRKTQLNRTIQSDTLDREFARITLISYGGSFPSYSLRERPLVDYGDVIEIDDCSEDDDEINTLTIGKQHQHREFVLQDARTLDEGISNGDMIPENLVKSEPDGLPTPTTSSYTPPAVTPIERRFNRLSTNSRSFGYLTPTNESEEFALNIARKLDKIPQNKRRQLEIDIEMKILETETEAIREEACFQ